MLAVYALRQIRGAVAEVERPHLLSVMGVMYHTSINIYGPPIVYIIACI